MTKNNSPLQKIVKDSGLFMGVALAVWVWLIVYAVFAYHPKYQSNSLILIKESAVTDRYVVPDQSYAMQTTSSSASNPVLNTMGLLQSEEISQALYHYFKAKHPEELRALKIKDPSDWDKYYTDGKPFLKYKNDLGTDLISIQFTWRDPQQTKEALQVVLKAFQEASLTLNRQEQRSRSAYLENQVDDIQRELEAVRKQKRIYKDQTGTANLDPQSESLVRSQIDMANRLNDAQASAQGKEAEFKRYESMLGMSPQSALIGTALGMNPTLAKLQDQYYQQAQNYAYLKATLTDKNPRVVETKAQLDQTQSDLVTETERTLGKHLYTGAAVADPTRGSLISKMVSAQADAVMMDTQARVMSQRLTQLNSQLGTLPTIEENLNNISEEEKSLSAALFTLRQKLLESRIKEAETLSNVFIVDSPRYPTSAKFPNQKHIIVGGLLLALLAGAAAVALKYMLPDALTEAQIAAGKARGRRAYDNLFAEAQAQRRAEDTRVVAPSQAINDVMIQAPIASVAESMNPSVTMASKTQPNSEPRIEPVALDFDTVTPDIRIDPPTVNPEWFVPSPASLMPQPLASASTLAPQVPGYEEGVAQNDTLTRTREMNRRLMAELKKEIPPSSHVSALQPQPPSQSVQNG